MPAVPYRIEIDPRDPHRYLQTEWLLTNGIGGYAMGTVLGVSTRRYHGLLVAATRPPVGRMVALHSLIEQLVIPRDDGSEDIIDLATQMFVGPDGEPMLHPGGWLHLREFISDHAFCMWRFQIGDLQINKRIAPNRNEFENDVSIRYEIDQLAVSSDRRTPILRIRPLVGLRDFHSVHRDGVGEFALESRAGCVSIERDGRTLRLESSAEFESSPQVWRRFALVEDRRRGQEWAEDLWSPGEFVSQISDQSGASVHISAIAPIESNSLARARFQVAAPAFNVVAPALDAAAQQFIVARRDDSHVDRSIIAGYPWFADWGRDAMISMPGMLLCTGRLDESQSILSLFARHMRRGIIPNCFQDRGGEPLYNSVDASLWYVYGVHQYHVARHRGGDGRHVARARTLAAGTPLPHSHGSTIDVVEHDADLLGACREVIDAYRRGTDFNIHMDPRDGLIIAGDATTQLTWMDAKRDSVVFTPRNGKAVEVNALWFNALRCMADMSNDALERSELLALSEQVRESFVSQFWWRERNCLHDVLVPVPVGGEGARGGGRFEPDGKLRPNQVFAASLPHSMLDRARQRALVNIVRERLLTPFGLRTLDRDDPDYRGRYEGNMFQRDAAYHNGTAWPWLIGPYCEAVLRVNDFSSDARAEVRRAIEPLLREMDAKRPPLFRGCLGQIAEVYDGDEPQRPDGCPAQAWSVAELIRVQSLIDEHE